MFLHPKTFSETGYQSPEHGARRSTTANTIFAAAPIKHESWWRRHLGFISIILVLTIVAGVVTVNKVESVKYYTGNDISNDILSLDSDLRKKLAASYKNTEWVSLDFKGFNDVKELLRAAEKNMRVVLDRARHEWLKPSDCSLRNFKIYMLNFKNGRFGYSKRQIKDPVKLCEGPAALYFSLLKLHNIMPYYFLILDHKKRLTLDELKGPEFHVLPLSQETLDELVDPEIHVIPLTDYISDEDNLKKLQHLYIYACRLAEKVDSLIEYTRRSANINSNK